MIRARIFLISGIPASGKSCFCRWLKDTKGWFHCEGDQYFGNHTVKSAIGEAQARTEPTVIDWGFPPACLSEVEWMKSQGVEIWWFDGDRNAAKTSFMERNETGQVCLTLAKHPATPQDMNRQLEAIDAAWNRIAEVFGSHVIKSVWKGPERPQYLPKEQIFQAICSDGV